MWILNFHSVCVCERQVKWFNKQFVVILLMKIPTFLSLPKIKRRFQLLHGSSSKVECLNYPYNVTCICLKVGLFNVAQISKQSFI